MTSQKETPGKTPPANALSITISHAAGRIGISPRQFRRVFLDTGRVRSLPMGERARVIDVAELERAYELYKTDQRVEVAH